MFNKKRIIVFLVFLLVMFFMITFAGSSVENAAVATREVIFTDGYNNKDIAKYQVEVGKDVEVPKDPYHKNYVFAGWFDFDNHDIKVTKFTNILADMHVIALYGKDINNNGIDDENDTYYTVTFVNSMTGGVIKTQEVLTGMDATAPKAPKVSGYRFTGWSRSYRNVTADITVNTVYVKEEEKVKTYKVTFIDGDTNEVISVEEVQEGLSATAPTPNEHENRLFSKWEGNYTNVTKDETVTAIYVDDKNKSGVDDEEEMVTIKFLPGEHGTINDDETTEFTLLKDYDEYPNAPALTIEKGYSFKEWNNDYATLISNNTKIPMENPVTEFTAQYNVNQYTITFDADGGKFSDNTTTKEVTGNYNTEVTAPEEPTRENYKFNGWDQEVPETMPAENKTIKATWKDDKNNNDVFDDEETFKVIYKDGDTVLKTVANLKLDDTLEEYTPSKEGYTFKEWTPTWENKVKAENANADSEIIYTATWEITKYTVTFKNYDGSVVATETVDYGTSMSEVTVPADPTKESTDPTKLYEFDKWVDSSNNELSTDTVVTTDLVYTATFTEYTLIRLDAVEKPGVQLEFPINGNTNIKDKINVYKVYSDGVEGHDEIKKSVDAADYSTDFRDNKSKYKATLTVTLETPALNPKLTNSDLKYTILEEGHEAYETKFEVHLNTTKKFDYVTNNKTCDSTDSNTSNNCSYKQSNLKHSVLSITEHYDEFIVVTGTKVKYEGSNTLHDLTVTKYVSYGKYDRSTGIIAHPVTLAGYLTETTNSWESAPQWDDWNNRTHNVKIDTSSDVANNSDKKIDEVIITYSKYRSSDGNGNYTDLIGTFKLTFEYRPGEDPDFVAISEEQVSNGRSRANVMKFVNPEVELAPVDTEEAVLDDATVIKEEEKVLNDTIGIETGENIVVDTPEVGGDNPNDDGEVVIPSTDNIIEPVVTDDSVLFTDETSSEIPTTEEPKEEVLPPATPVVEKPVVEETPAAEEVVEKTPVVEEPVVEKNETSQKNEEKSEATEVEEEK